jgi:glutamate N-acetyltransferase / amino-acid N-acetyltransferase
MEKDILIMSAMDRTVQLPAGFRAAATACGIKRDASKLDLSLIVSSRPAAAAGVFTQNRVAAAPVQLCRQRVPSSSVRAIVVNSGNANACTGDAGFADAKKMGECVAAQLDCAPGAVLVCSTGIIGERLPMQKIQAGIQHAAQNLSADASAIQRAAQGIMTTDTRQKIAHRSVQLDGQSVQLVGIAKGAAMIAPNMATMLSFLITDAKIAPDALQSCLKTAVDRSFNMISVEGHMSTNDTVLALANGAAGATEASGASLARFAELFNEVCTELAQEIVRDAEGAKHFVTIDVEGMRTPADARRVAKAVAESALVKTAIYGADPNWGRVVSAAGYSGVDFSERDLSLWLDDRLLYDRGAPVEFDSKAVSERLRTERSACLRLKFELGTSNCQFWTCDLTEEYIKLNADYHT